MTATIEQIAPLLSDRRNERVVGDRMKITVCHFVQERHNEECATVTVELLWFYSFCVYFTKWIRATNNAKISLCNCYFTHQSKI